jgi:hypothetical protein
MLAETIIMFLNGRWGYTPAYRQTERCWFVTELLDAFSPKPCGSILQEKLEKFEFETITGPEMLDINYKNGLFEISYALADDFDDPRNYIHITPKLLHAIITQWLKIKNPKLPYIRIDIDWEREQVTMQAIETWNGPLNAMNLSCQLPPRPIGQGSA